MTREQRLFEAARALCNGISANELDRALRHDNYPILESATRVTDFIALEKAVSVYEGVAFSDGQEQDISPDAPNYNPKVSGRL